MTPYTAAVAREAALWSPYVAGRQFETVFFGGGTPSILPLPEMRTIVDGLRANFDIAAEAEVSLEANPGTVNAAHLQGLRDMGFNRISFGVQSFHEEELRSLDRIHDAQEVEDAYRWARAAGFDNVNLDLIYGLIGQGMEGWQTNLEKALVLEPDHLSLYALTLEEGTPLTRDVARGRSPGPDLDLQADMFEWSRERLVPASFHHYEVSNWARFGRECRHNLVYWHNGDWLGLGAGAHSHLYNQRFADAASPSRYIALVEGQGTGNKEPGTSPTDPLSASAERRNGARAFRRKLLAWYARHARDLPWRRTRDPYRVLVSEVMLQQTQVSRVTEYYPRFLERFPTLEHLARARPKAVREQWDGLGYYSRAANLHALAREVVRGYEAKLPDDPAELLKLPGVGRYTAGAVASFAYEKPVPAVDTNVRRVIGRVFVGEGAKRLRGEGAIWRLAAALVPPDGKRAWKLNQALMELGAVVCVARKPKCPECPVVTECKTGGGKRRRG